MLYLCEKEHIEGGMIFQLLEDLTEMSTMRNCKDIFGYIESKQDILGKVSFLLLELTFGLTSDLFCVFNDQSFQYDPARAVCSWKTRHVENMQSTSSSTIKGIMIHSICPLNSL